MKIDLSKLGSKSDKKHGEPLDYPVCVCRFDKALSAGQLIDFGGPVRPVIDCIEHFPTHQLVHSRVVSLYFVTRFLTELVTGQGVPAWLRCYDYLMIYRRWSHCWLVLSHMKMRCLTGLISVVMPRLNGIDMQAVMTS